jgi:hypothetical protein
MNNRVKPHEQFLAVVCVVCVIAMLAFGLSAIGDLIVSFK